MQQGARQPKLDAEDLASLVHSPLGRQYYDLWSSGQIGLGAVHLHQVAELFEIEEADKDKQAGSEDTSRSSWDREHFPDEGEVMDNRVPAALRIVDAGIGHGLPDAAEPRQPHDEEGREMDVEGEEGDETGLMQRIPRKLSEVCRVPCNNSRACRLPKPPDMRRPAPHLWRPALRERHARVEALLSVFAEQGQGMREEEQQWCNQKWVQIAPFLDDVECDVRRDSEGEDVPEDTPRENAEGQEQGESSAVEAEVVAIEDSQEPVQEGGSQVQAARLTNGTTRELLPQELQQLQWNELVEEEAASMDMQTERGQWASLETSLYQTWQQWETANLPAEHGVKRIQVRI